MSNEFQDMSTTPTLTLEPFQVQEEKKSPVAQQAEPSLDDSALTEEFFRAFAFNAGITLHLQILYGGNAHHMTEALFKAAAHALRKALYPASGVLSTKGAIDV